MKIHLNAAENSWIKVTNVYVPTYWIFLFGSLQTKSPDTGKRLHPKDGAILSNFKICYKNHNYKKSDTVSLLSCYTIKIKQ